MDTFDQLADSGREGMASADAGPNDMLANSDGAWELLEAGRYRPLRIRGSCRGRELG